LKSRHSSNDNHYYLLLKKLTPKWQLKVKDSIVDANNRLNSIFNSFNPFSSKFSPGNRLIDIFSSRFSFHLSNRKCTEEEKIYLHKLDELILLASVDPKTVIVMLDASIKNQVTIFIAYIHIHNTSSIKTIHYTINVTFTKAKLFAIRCGLNQTIQLTNIEYIIVIIDSIHAAKIDSSIHLY